MFESNRVTKMTIFAVIWVFLCLMGMAHCSAQISDRTAEEIAEEHQFDRYEIVLNDEDEGITIYRDNADHKKIIVKWSEFGEIVSRGYVYPYEHHDPWEMIDRFNESMRKSQNDPRTWSFVDEEEDMLYKFQLTFHEDDFMILVQSIEV